MLTFKKSSVQQKLNKYATNVDLKGRVDPVKRHQQGHVIRRAVMRFLLVLVLNYDSIFWKKLLVTPFHVTWPKIPFRIPKTSCETTLDVRNEKHRYYNLPLVCLISCRISWSSFNIWRIHNSALCSAEETRSKTKTLMIQCELHHQYD